MLPGSKKLRISAKSGKTVNFCVVFGGEIFIYTTLNGTLTKKKLPYAGSNFSPPACKKNCYFTAPSVTNCFHIACDFKSDSLNVMENECIKFF